MSTFLIETALLTHGLVSVSDDELRQRWPQDLDCLVWVDQGQIVTGSLEQYLPLRRQMAQQERVTDQMLPQLLAQKGSGALTASGTMEACRRLGLPLAVTCGMGGIGEVENEMLCPDLPALRDLPVALVATSPKDMLDIPATISWLQQADVLVLGVGTDRCTGYLFDSADVALSGRFMGGCLPRTKRLLLLQPIEKTARVQDLSLLQAGKEAGRQAEQAGREYHPAANAAFDRLTGGHSSQIQLQSLIANARLAQTLTVPAVDQI